MDIEGRVKGFIQQSFLSKGDKDELTRDESLLDSGLIDSTAVLELVGFLESEFGIEVADEDVVPENFETVGSLVAFVNRKR